jgi:translation initiation factor 1A
MPNLKGGKKYKSSKGGEAEHEFHEIDVSEGQSVARVLKKLGDRNFLLWCNDGKERIAHVRGKLKKRVWIDIGDVVLYSERGDNLNLTLESKSSERGDILAKYDRSVYSQLKKYPGVNPKLFTNIESMDSAQRAAGGEDDFGFTFEAVEEEETETDSEDTEDAEDAKRERAAKKVEADKKRSAARNTKMSSAAVGGGKDSDEVDIDAI